MKDNGAVVECCYCSDSKYTFVFFLRLAYVHVSFCLTALKREWWHVALKSVRVICALLSHNSRYTVSEMLHKSNSKLNCGKAIKRIHCTSKSLQLNTWWERTIKCKEEVLMCWIVITVGCVVMCTSFGTFNCK